MADTVSYTGETRLGDSPVYLVENRRDSNRYERMRVCFGVGVRIIIT